MCILSVAVICFLYVLLQWGQDSDLKSSNFEDRQELASLRRQLHQTQEQLRKMGTALADRGGARPKYHVSSLLSAHGIPCQNHLKFLTGHADPLVVECGAATGNEAAEMSHKYVPDLLSLWAADAGHLLFGAKERIGGHLFLGGG